MVRKGKSRYYIEISLSGMERCHLTKKWGKKGNGLIASHLPKPEFIKKIIQL
jgi:hypothetical protein